MMQLDIAAALTALSLVIGSIATVIVALKGAQRTPTDKENNDKAVAVSEIRDTTDRVDILWEHIIDLREELATLRKEKEDLEEKYEELSKALAKEQGDHAETRRMLDDALAQIAEKDKRIKELEEKLNGSIT